MLNEQMFSYTMVPSGVSLVKMHFYLNADNAGFTFHYDSSRFGLGEVNKEKAEELIRSSTHGDTDGDMFYLLTSIENYPVMVYYDEDDNVLSVNVVSNDFDTSKRIAEKLAEALWTPQEIEEDKIEFGFWRQNSRGDSVMSRRALESPVWDEINRNYSGNAKVGVEKLISTELGDSDADGGKLILLHGPPGTGKTTALRMLAQEWRKWCEFEVVLDPERFFNDPNYIMDTLLRGSHEDKWRLLILEDCDELIGEDAKERTGQSLSRLLNLTDGLLGQGQKLLIAITTNKDIRDLHKAITRPGRCLTNINVGKFNQEEAAAWLGIDPISAPREATLAELYARKNDMADIEFKEADTASLTGQYL